MPNIGENSGYKALYSQTIERRMTITEIHFFYCLTGYNKSLILSYDFILTICCESLVAFF